MTFIREEHEKKFKYILRERDLARGLQGIFGNPNFWSERHSFEHARGDCSQVGPRRDSFGWTLEDDSFILIYCPEAYKPIRAFRALSKVNLENISAFQESFEEVAIGRRIGQNDGPSATLTYFFSTRDDFLTDIQAFLGGSLISKSEDFQKKVFPRYRDKLLPRIGIDLEDPRKLSERGIKITREKFLYIVKELVSIECPALLRASEKNAF